MSYKDQHAARVIMLIKHSTVDGLNLCRLFTVRLLYRDSVFQCLYFFVTFHFYVAQRSDSAAVVHSNQLLRCIAAASSSRIYLLFMQLPSMYLLL